MTKLTLSYNTTLLIPNASIPAVLEYGEDKDKGGAVLYPVVLIILDIIVYVELFIIVLVLDLLKLILIQQHGRRLLTR